MEYIIDILKITLPALLVLWAAYGTMTRFLSREEQKRGAEHKVNKEALALRLKAYERLTLFLERINPENLIQRMDSDNENCADLQINLLKTIRWEYEHNLTQQLYVSDEAWSAILMAKESLKQLINASMTGVDPNGASLSLAQIIIETYHSSEVSPIDIALKQLKADVVGIMA